MNQIFNIEKLVELQEFLFANEVESLRESLIKLFLKYADYKNVNEWNKVVRVCECLAIIGWGNYQPLEAIRGTFINGKPETYFFDKFSKPHFVHAIWSKKKSGYTMEQGQTTYYFSSMLNTKQTIFWDYPVKEDIQDIKILTQRNWIPQNPVLIRRFIGNCYDESKFIIESIETDLQHELDIGMKPETYGKQICRILLRCCYSYKSNNYIIIEDTEYTEVKTRNPGDCLRNRIKYGRFNTNTGLVRNEIYFEKELSNLSAEAQKDKILTYISIALKGSIERLKKKKLIYSFDKMLNDFNEIVNRWKTKLPPTTP